MLKPRSRPGSPPSSHAHAVLRGNAAATVKLLSETGVDRPDAHRSVATLLKELGVRTTRGSGEITDETVRHWCEEAAEDVSRQGAVAMAYDSVLAEIGPKTSVLPRDQARRRVLDSLADFIRRLFPEYALKNPPNPPI